MTTYKSDACEYPSLRPAVTASQAGVMLVSIGAAAVDDSLAKDDIVQLCKLPAGHVPVDFQLEATKLDDNDTEAITISVGVLNADGDGLVQDDEDNDATNFLTDDTVAQAGGVARADELDGLGLAPSDKDRIIAAKVTTVAATKAAGTLRGKLTYCENP